MTEEFEKKGKSELEKIKKKGEYLYCIIAKKDSPKTFDIKGIEDSELSTISYNDLTAVISSAAVKEYEPTEEDAKIHREVTLNILKNHSVLPVAFGMVFKDKRTLLMTMRRVYPILKKSLKAVENKVELGVKIIFPKEAEKNFEEWGKGKSIDEFRKECELDFVETLNKVAEKSKKNKLFSERLVLNHSFLVDRDKIDEFSAVLSKLDDKYQSLKTQYTGPWPTYNFVDIRIMGKGR